MLMMVIVHNPAHGFVTMMISGKIYVLMMMLLVSVHRVVDAAIDRGRVLATSSEREIYWNKWCGYV